jgi:hypothetical protein
MIDYEDGNAIYCCIISGVFLVDLGVDGGGNIKLNLKDTGCKSVD